MPQPPPTPERPARIPGLDAEATPVLGIGLGLTGLALGFKPRLAPLTLGLTALAAAFFRDPVRTTPNEPHFLFAPADGVVSLVDELYEHQFIHSDCVRIVIESSPLDVPIIRAPMAGTLQQLTVSDQGSGPLVARLGMRPHLQLLFGLGTGLGPLLINVRGGPLARGGALGSLGSTVAAGERLAILRFGGQTELIAQRDSLNLLIQPGSHISAGTTCLARVTPL